jgi:hypothetical protein
MKLVITQFSSGSCYFKYFHFRTKEIRKWIAFPTLPQLPLVQLSRTLQTSQCIRWTATTVLPVLRLRPHAKVNILLQVECTWFWIAYLFLWSARKKSSHIVRMSQRQHAVWLFVLIDPWKGRSLKAWLLFLITVTTQCKELLCGLHLLHRNISQFVNPYIYPSLMHLFWNWRRKEHWRNWKTKIVQIRTTAVSLEIYVRYVT